MAQLAAQLHHMEKDKCSSHFTSTSTVAGLRVVVVRFQPTVSEPLFVLGRGQVHKSKRSRGTRVKHHHVIERN